MKISRLVAATNWRYAVGEVALIVVGVTIALAGTSWYEGRQERRAEILVLQQLRSTLTEDLHDINRTREITRQRVQNITELLMHLELDGPYTHEVGLKFQSLLGWRIVSLTTAPFEALKVQNYRVISNVDLRNKLISFFEDDYRKLEHNLNLDRDFAIDKIQPYYFENFVMRIASANDVDGGSQEWVPKDYEKVKAESYIANLCRYRGDLLRRFALQQYDDTAVAIREILNTIDQELAAAD